MKNTNDEDKKTGSLRRIYENITEIKICGEKWGDVVR